MSGNLDVFQRKYFEVLANSDYIRSIRKPGRELIGLRSYIYNVVVGPSLLLNVPISTTLETQADSDFALAYLSASANQSANADMQFNRNLTLQIQDLSTGKLFFSAPTVMTLVTGGGGFPYVFPVPRVVNANSQLLFTVNNRDTAVNYNQAFLSLGGIRLFYR
jgi:hypothetical protein